MHLEDIVLRRTLLAMLGMLDRALLVELAKLCGDALGWSDLFEIRRFGVGDDMFHFYKVVNGLEYLSHVIRKNRNKPK